MVGRLTNYIQGALIARYSCLHVLCTYINIWLKVI